MANKLVEQAKAQVKANKQPKTIKISTLIKHIIIGITILLAFAGGALFNNVMRDKNDDNVKKQAVVYLKDVTAVIEAVKK